MPIRRQRADAAAQQLALELIAVGAYGVHHRCHSASRLALLPPQARLQRRRDG
jgi:hypothetical protein